MPPRPDAGAQPEAAAGLATRSEKVGARQRAKRVDPNAYNALADALCVVVWNKQPFARVLPGERRLVAYSEYL
jgi:hypothetical protein